jgi:ATP-binding cassette subfamily B (MDR/TAP) protein 1
MGFLLYEVFSSFASLGVALYYSWKLSLVIISSFPIAATGLYFVSRRLGPAIEAQKRELTQASKYANTAMSSIITVKAYNGQEHEIWQYYETIKKVAACYLIQAAANAMQYGITKFVMVSIFVQGMDPGHVLTTFYACLNAMQAMETVLPEWMVLAKGISAGQTLQSIRVQMQNGRKVTKMVGSLRPRVCFGDIELNQVSS